MTQIEQRIGDYRLLRLHSAHQGSRTVLVYDIMSKHPKALEDTARVAKGLNIVIFPCINQQKQQLELNLHTPSWATLSAEEFDLKVQHFTSDLASAVRSVSRGSDRRLDHARRLFSGL